MFLIMSKSCSLWKKVVSKKNLKWILKNVFEIFFWKKLFGKKFLETSGRYFAEITLGYIQIHIKIRKF